MQDGKITELGAERAVARTPSSSPPLPPPPPRSSSSSGAAALVAAGRDADSAEEEASMEAEDAHVAGGEQVAEGERAAATTEAPVGSGADNDTNNEGRNAQPQPHDHPCNTLSPTLTSLPSPPPSLLTPHQSRSTLSPHPRHHIHRSPLSPLSSTLSPQLSTSPSHSSSTPVSITTTISTSTHLTLALTSPTPPTPADTDEEEGGNSRV